jgi:LysR family cys regulon transcriptional activator
MNVKQLRCILEVVRSGLSISHAAERLNTVQPGISTQIKMLEEELGTLIFQRHGRRLVGVTPAGEQIIHTLRATAKL